MATTALVGTRKGLFVVERRGDTWSVASAHFVGDRVSLGCADPRDGAWYAALDHGHFGVKIHRSDDRGVSWRELPAPAFPEKPADDDDKVPWSTSLVWALCPSGPDQPGTLWCGTIPGGLFKSTDRGESWVFNRALWDDPRRREWFGGGADHPGIHSISVDPRDSNQIVVGVSCGGVWQTRDGGESWALRAEGMRAAYMPPERATDPTIQDPHCIVRSPSQPDTLWAQHHNGIFRTTDGCETWHEFDSVKPSTFGFAVAVHPSDPDRAWFVPAESDERRIPVDGRVVVTRTRDGGKTFEILSEGLPATFSYDLVFRHALDIDDSGDRLMFGSTTGSLWATADQGDHWQVISQHLPPIFSVEFVR